ncbi:MULTISPECIES: TIGR02678 family protein [Alicyclobacillus]|uniref:TIGR02678 family protein n=1 Tax=Alicyclobacillus vulcanalis TaxID=252246 RepID=A0A1N7NY83_9BACL|nr:MULTISPECIES: TIGR02678 family protein [Alicyclobacillus]SIT03325.1 TIGR02678 family protein [Alicyclobacillus vulcanalis]
MRHGRSRGEREELQQAARLLLSRPWVTKEQQPEEYRLVHRHQHALRDWFQKMAGWALVVTSEIAKLEKQPAVHRPWMRIDEFLHPRDYALFAYALWFLEGRQREEQFLLSELIDAIGEESRRNGDELDWTNYDHRLSMVRALKKLRDLGVLQAVDGEENAWARDDTQNVLYEATRLARYVMNRFPRDFASYQTIDELYEADIFMGSDGSSEWESWATAHRRHRVIRRFLVEPVVYDADFSEEERRYVQTQRSFLVDRIEQLTGLMGRRFREGLLFTWPDLRGEFEWFPGESTLSDVCLLVANVLVERIREKHASLAPAEHGRYHVPLGELEALILELRNIHGPRWSKELREKAVAALTRDVLAMMSEWHLVAWDGADVWLLPALSRYVGAYDGELAQEEGSDGAAISTVSRGAF